MRIPFIIVFLLVLAKSLSFGQSPFDGRWLNKVSEQVPQGPMSYSLIKENFRCPCAVGNIETTPDGDDHKLRETPYGDTINVQAVDSHTVAILAKKAGRITYIQK